MPTTNRTALVTGTSSGLGFEASAQLAEQRFARVIVTARTDPVMTYLSRSLSTTTISTRSRRPPECSPNEGDRSTCSSSTPG
jgi:short-subunit dehydrogenase